MIINPEINNLSPATSVAGLPSSSNTSTRHNKPAMPPPQADDPPPYTVIDVITFGESVIDQEGLDIVTSSAITDQFCRSKPDMDCPRDRSWSTNEITSRATMTLRIPGFEEIQEGGQQILDSTRLLAATSLIVAGGVIEGIGKIVAGVGRAIASRRTPNTRKAL